MVDHTRAPTQLAARATWLWTTFVRRPALPWTGNVSYRIGSWIAAAAFGTRLSPNAVTLAGLGVHAIGAAMVVALPAGWPAIAAIAIVWQVAFGLDCADGLLARSRGETSAFGAWLDQVVDFVAHVLVFGALAQVVVRDLDVSATWAVAFAVFVVGGNSILGYAVGVKGATRVEGRNVTKGADPASTAAGAVLSATDYGFVLFASSVLLAAPALLAAYIVLNGVLSTAAVVGQLLVYSRARRIE